MKGYRECPDCGQEHKITIKRCGCGYRWDEKPKRVRDPNYGLCEWEADGMRCANPGSCSTSTTGGGPWFCLEHSVCKDGQIGAEIVRRSNMLKAPAESLDEKSLAWLESRGIKRSPGMSDAQFAEVCREYAVYLAKVQPDRSRGNKAWAERLRAREQAVEPLSMVQRKAWREALIVPNGAAYEGEVTAREVSA